MNELEQNPTFKFIKDFLTEIMAMPEESLNEVTLDMTRKSLEASFTPELREKMIENIINAFNNMAYTRGQINQGIDEAKAFLANVVETLQPSDNKRALINSVFEVFYECYDAAKERYHSYDIVLPIKLDEGAQVPTYAHDTDAAADLYAADDTTILANSISNMVRTGVHIALPEGWAAIVIPRSSIGMKTGLRLSNSQGLIDSDYRGPIGVIYDNISDTDYEIKQGDRIAQLYVVPAYRFKPNIVDTLPETERGEGGFGSSGR